MTLLEFALVYENAIKKFCLVGGGENPPPYLCRGRWNPPPGGADLVKVQIDVELAHTLLLMRTDYANSDIPLVFSFRINNYECIFIFLLIAFLPR